MVAILKEAYATWRSANDGFPVFNVLYDPPIASENIIEFADRTTWTSYRNADPAHFPSNGPAATVTTETSDPWDEVHIVWCKTILLDDPLTFTWRDCPTPGPGVTPCTILEHDLLNILTHEMGHWWALADLGPQRYNDNGAGNECFVDTVTMWHEAVTWGERQKRDLAPSDAACLQALIKLPRPDAVVQDFRAWSTPAGVDLFWRASAEDLTAKYLVLRGTGRAGPFAVVQEVPRGSEGRYSVLDPGTTSGIYKLLEVELDGDTLLVAADSVGGVPPDTAVVWVATNAESLYLSQVETYGGEVSNEVTPATAKWLCIAPDDWTDEVQPLAAFWTGRGHDAAVVSLSSVGGAQNIREYLRPLWQAGTLSYVLLLGDASDATWWVDNAKWSGPWTGYRPAWPAQPGRNIIPMSYYVPDLRPQDDGMTAFTPYYSSDWGYVDFDGDSLPELALGRAPVVSASEVTTFVQKTINAANTPPGCTAAKNAGIWVGGRSSGTKSGLRPIEYGDELAELLPQGVAARKIYDTDAAPLWNNEKRTLAIGALNEGRSIIVTTSTGSDRYSWSGFLSQAGGVFQWGHTIANPAACPFLLGLTCDLGDIDRTEDPALLSPLLERGLVTPDRGPWGAFGPTRGTWTGGGFQIGREFMARLYGSPTISAGMAAKEAVHEIAQRLPWFRPNAQSFVFIGDPLVGMPSPNPGPLSASIGGPRLVGPGSLGTWVANGSGGDCTYSNQWRERATGSSTWTGVLGTGPVYQATKFWDFWLRVRVESAGMADSTDICVGNTGEPATPVVTMGGPAAACIGESPTWSVASMSGGRSCGQYTYAWRWRPVGGEWSGIVSTSPSYSRQVESGGLELKLEATSVTTLLVASVTKAVAATQCAVTDLYPDLITETEVWLNWTSPSVLTGSPEEYDLRRSSSAINANNFAAATRVLGAPAPGPTGTYEGYGVAGLTPNRTYWFAIKTKDAAGHWSPISNVCSATTLDDDTGCWGCFGATKVPLNHVEQNEGSGDISTGTGSSGTNARARNASAKILERLASAMDLVRPRLGRTGEVALSAEMTPGIAGPAWTLYYVDSTETAELRGTDTTVIVLQYAGEGGGWRSRLRVRPTERNWRFAVRGWNRPGRAVFLGSFSLMQAWTAVGYPAAGENAVLNVTSARHSRLGDVKGAMDAAGSYDLGFTPGDTLVLAYGRAPDSTEAVQDWFLLVGASSTSTGPGGRRRIGTGDAQQIPSAFALRQNQPNPFDRTTSIRFELPSETEVRLEIFDAQGRLVRTLADRGYPAGFHALEWDHRTDGGKALGAGVYLYRIQAGSFRDQKKMVLLAK